MYPHFASLRDQLLLVKCFRLAKRCFACIVIKIINYDQGYEKNAKGIEYNRNNHIVRMGCFMPANCQVYSASGATRATKSKAHKFKQQHCHEGDCKIVENVTHTSLELTEEDR